MSQSIADESTSLLKAARQALGQIPGARKLKRALTHALSSRNKQQLLEAYDIGMTQRTTEIGALAGLVRDLRPTRVLEIGTSRGGTFYLWTRLAGDEATLVSVDLPPVWTLGDLEEEPKLALFNGFQRERQSLHFIRRDSHLVETRTEVCAIFGNTPIDFLFIDGDHSYGGVRGDFLDYGPLVRAGGIIAFHDILPHSAGLGGEVWRFWQEVRARYEGIELVEDTQQNGFGIGVIRVREGYRIR
jgi:predicted O-methyltransferase YrrM